MLNYVQLWQSYLLVGGDAWHNFGKILVKDHVRTIPPKLCCYWLSSLRQEDFFKYHPLFSIFSKGGHFGRWVEMPDTVLLEDNPSQFHQILVEIQKRRFLCWQTNKWWQKLTWPFRPEELNIQYIYLCTYLFFSFRFFFKNCHENDIFFNVYISHP